MASSLHGYPKVWVRQAVVKEIKGGHPWVFSKAIEKQEPIADGGLCHIYYQNTFLATGYYNSRSDIRIRILSRRQSFIDQNFWQSRLSELLPQKKRWLSNTNAFRWVFGESDGLPGLVIDVYDRYVVLQIHTLGMEKQKEMIVRAICETFSPLGIYEKSDLSVREKEGLRRYEGLLEGELPDEILIQENEFRFWVNIKEGQKTGFFLDQRENRKAILPFCEGQTVLNCFCYTGAFSVYAAKKASKVISVDVSQKALELARKNFAVNGLGLQEHEFIEADVFEFLPTFPKGEAQVIILDPPALAKNRLQRQKAQNAYLTLNAKAVEKLPDYGILISSSCTTHVDHESFLNILQQAAQKNHCHLKLLEARYQPFDHSYNLSFPQGRYLKFFILQKWPFS